jgi:primosomal protein N'
LLGDQTEKSNIFFGNKLTLLYNLNSIEKIIIVDEANPSYISESKIYFDAREIAFWLSKIYGIELNFISHLPSIRFLDSIQKELKELKYPKIKLKFLERSGRQNDFENIIHELNEEIESYHYNDDDIE